MRKHCLIALVLEMDPRREYLHYRLIAPSPDITRSLRLLTGDELVPHGTPQIYRCRPGWHWSPPPLPDFDLWCVLAGRGKMDLDDRTHLLAPGVAFLLPPGAAPRARQDLPHPLLVFACHFDFRSGSRPARAALRRALPSGPHGTTDLPFVHDLARRAEECHLRGGAADHAESAACVRLILLHLFSSRVAPPAAPRDAALERVLAEMRQDPARPWSIATMARRAGLSRAQFHRRFLLAAGAAPNRYLINLRIARARQLILETTMSMQEIAHATGYEDVYFFSRQYKQITGAAPSVLRRDRATAPSSGRLS